LSSVLDTNYPNYEVYLIDNGSIDRSVEYVQQKYPSVKIIRNSKNLGFAEAYNRAINQIAAEYVVLLNNDTEILNPKWLHHLVQIAKEEPKVAAVATKMVSMEDQRLLESVGIMGVRFWRGFADIGKGESDAGQYPRSFEPFGFCGGAALLRREAFLTAGKFDEQFILYTEDVDLSWRLRLLGWKIRYCPDARVAHKRGGSSGGAALTAPGIYYGLRNALRTILKNCGSSLAWALRSFILFTTMAFFGFAAFQPTLASAPLKAVGWNLKHLRDTLQHRCAVQRTRMISESEILRAMYPALARRENGYVGHDTMRGILTKLLDYGQRKSFARQT
jgi:GT2 family glycosyltransferase